MILRSGVRALSLLLVVFFLLGTLGCGRPSGDAALEPGERPGEPAQPAEVATSVYDTATLRANASFEIAVADGVYWVPASALGVPQFRAKEILDLGRDPDVLKGKVKTLYDVIQYVQTAKFRDADDNIREQHGRISWEYHKPGPEAIRTNEGCCATISNLLAFLLAGDYEEVGFIQYSQLDGQGHVFNYIRHDGQYYTVDLTKYRLDFLWTAVESGELHDYHRSDYVEGNVHRVDRLEDYVRYCLSEFNEPPCLFVAYSAEAVLDIGTIWVEDRIELYYPSGSSVQILWDDPDDRLSLQYATAPPRKGNWDHIAGAVVKPHPGAEPAKLEIRFSQNPWRVFEGGGQEHWYQRFEIAETSGVDVQLIDVRIGYMVDEYRQDAEVWPAKDMFGESGGYLPGGSSLYWRGGGSGVIQGTRYHDYTVRGTDANGHPVLVTGRVHFEYGPPPISEDSYNRGSLEPSVYDTENLRANADFRVGVASGVYWVPVVHLGEPDYARQEILALGRDPEVLRSSIRTLYDVIQYVQTTGFTEASDNRRIVEAGIDWEHHKPGQYAIKTNEGCCATVSNLLAYLLAGDYEEVGFLQNSWQSGTGHVQNYIRHEGKYYMMDMTCQLSDRLGDRVETGEAHDYFPRNNMITGYILEVERLEDYVAYCMAEFNAPPVLWTAHTAPRVLPIGTVFGQDRVTLYYPVGSAVRVVWDDPDDRLFLEFVPGPTRFPDWTD